MASKIYYVVLLQVVQVQYFGFWKLWSMLVELGNHQSAVRSRPAARRRLHAVLLLGTFC